PEQEWCLSLPQVMSYQEHSRLGFPCTNNIAEYEALIAGLKLAITWNIRQLRVIGDSQLIIKQVNDEYK
ncbi:hypothetical protein KI387_003263, partial [Taxus chinensis]